MRILHGMAMATVLITATPAAADPWKDESGHGYAPYAHRHGEWKQEWRDGPCKYERKWESSGEYKEEIKCDGQDDGYYLSAPAVVIPAPVPPPSLTIVVPID